MFHPTTIVKPNIDERVLSDSSKAALKRIFSNVSSACSISSHAPKDETHAYENHLGLTVMINKPFWRQGDEAQDAFWAEELEPWLAKKLAVVSSTVANTRNNVEGPIDEAICFSYLDVTIGSLTVSIKYDPCNGFSKSMELLHTLRTALCSEALKGANITRVIMPSYSPDFLKTEESVDADCAQANGGCDSSIEAEEIEIDQDGCIKIDKAEPLDYAIWTIETVDGTSFEFNSLAGTIE